MYLDFYGLKESPFSLVCDPRFLYYSDSHCEAMAHVLYGVRERKGLILLLGEAGTGKTTLVAATLEMLRSTRVITSSIMNPMLQQPEELLEAILLGYKLQGYKRTSLEMAGVLQRFLLQQVNRGQIPVLIVDEAQELSRPLLEQLRLLSNLEAQGQKLLQIVLSSQPEMTDKLDTFELRALKQRIAIRYRLNHLTSDETWRYLATRVAHAGGDGRLIFTISAAETIYDYSCGIPRLLNMLADNCLLAGFAKNRALIEPSLVEEVASHLELTPAGTPDHSRSSIPEDVMRASSSWKEIAEDIKHATVPPAFQQFIEKLRSPELQPGTQKIMSASAQGSTK